eukprot:gene3880-4841_t
MSIQKILVSLGLLLVCSSILLVNAVHHPRSGWIKSMDRTSDHEIVTFNVYLKQQNLPQLTNKVKSVSDPKSDSYGQYLNKQEIAAIVAPSQESIYAVEQWINAHHPLSSEIHSHQDSIKVRMFKKNVERMFSVKMNKFVHPNGNIILRSSVEGTIPNHVKPHIDLVTGISSFPELKLNKKVVDEKLMNQVEDGAQFKIVGLKGASESVTITYIPSCSPNCNSGNVSPVTVTITTINTLNSRSHVSKSVTPVCPPGEPVCTLEARCFLYEPSSVSINEDSTGASNQWPFQFISTPIVVPQTIKSYYGIPDNYVVTNQSATQCVVEFEQQYYSPSDLNRFFVSMGLPTNTPVNVIGYNDATNPGVEASLDIQYMMGVSVGSPTTFWSIYANSSAEIDDILAWAVAIADYPNPPIVNSLSYGMTEGNVDEFLGQGYLARSDVEFQKLALMGITIIIASGDAGASDLGGPPMSGSDCSQLRGDWPSQSPYVTAVGSVYFTPYSEPICYENIANGGIDCKDNPVGEVGVSVDAGLMWTTGGGFSNITTTAFYQEDFVNSYLNTLDTLQLTPPNYLFNRSGRAYPDFSSVGHNLYVINGGKWLQVDGTSASAPIFAGMITILNDVRLNAGLPALGFLNPLFYQIAREYPDAFYDVIVGNNRCGVTNFNPVCCPYGYTAVEGFDAVGGLGRPNMSILMKIINDYANN